PPDLHSFPTRRSSDLERHFKTAAERGAVDRGHDRLRRILHDGQHLMQTGRLRRLAEFGDVGAGDEGAPRASQHDGFYFRIGDRRSEEHTSELQSLAYL